MIESELFALLGLKTFENELEQKDSEKQLELLQKDLKQQLGYFEKKRATAQKDELNINENQLFYYFNQCIADLENNKLEGIEINKLMNKIKKKSKIKDNEGLVTKFKNSLKTNSNQWRFLIEFLNQLFGQMSLHLIEKDVS